MTYQLTRKAVEPSRELVEYYKKELQEATAHRLDAYAYWCRRQLIALNADLW